MTTGSYNDLQNKILVNDKLDVSSGLPVWINDLPTDALKTGLTNYKANK